MLDKLGSRAFIIPIVMGIVLTFVLGLAVTPMLRADVHNVPFAIVNLDKGATTVGGSTNAGQTLTDKLLSGETSLGAANNSDDSDSSSTNTSATMAWTQLSSQQDLQNALANNTYYGGIVIPDNFTSQQMYTKVGLGNAPVITVYLNKGKNPQMATTMQTTIENAMLQNGIACDVQIVNDADIGGGSIADSMAVQMTVMPLTIMTLITAIITSLLVWKRDVLGIKEKSSALALAIQIALLGVFTAVLAALAMCIDIFFGGLAIPWHQMFLLLWLGSFCTAMLISEAFNVSLPLGALVAFCVFALGMGTAMLAPEMLTNFWATWVYPWAPQARLGNGIRSIIYFGKFPSGYDINMLLVLAGIGLMCGVLGCVISYIKKKRGEHATSSEE